MREISLTQGYIALVDDRDYPVVSQYKWHVLKTNRSNYAAHTICRNKAKGRMKTEVILMHRLIMDAQPGELVDHYNSDGLKNTRDNLRKCSPQQNSRNRRTNIGFKTSEYKGVTKRWRKVNNRIYGPYFEVRLCIDSKRVHIGFFKDEIEAAKAYDKAARENFGEFALLNLPQYEREVITQA